MAYKIIDVSTWQDAIDWQKVKADGVQGVILRACFGWDWQGDKQVDKKFFEYVKGAKAVGLPIGAYHYSYASNRNEAIREAISFMKVIKGIDFELPVFYDVEEPTVVHKLSGAQLTDVSCAFCEEMEKNGYYVGVYSSTSLMKKMDYNRIKRYTLWVAQYFTSCQYPNKHDMWQYSSDGSVNGIKGRVDMNHCYRDYIGEIQTRGGNPKIEQKEDENVIKDLQEEINLLNSQLANARNLIINRDNEISRIKNELVVSQNKTAQAEDNLNSLRDEIDRLSNVNIASTGDVNGDGKVNTVDALLILKNKAGL